MFVTYNGDNFDWPYVCSRCAVYNIHISHELGIHRASGTEDLVSNDAEYVGRCIVHLDAFKWVQRDSYLPQGCQGLKSVTKAKLG